jgi:glycosyltransferase involved in cell wall biosynthesis
VSVIATVKNEGECINHLLESLLAQTRTPDEIIIVDGGSSDGTLMQLRQWERSGRLPLRVLSAPGANISRGRNVAIEAASKPIIAATDAGVQLDAAWVAEIIRPFEDTPGARPIPDVVSGFFVPRTQSVFETAMAATVLPNLADVPSDRFLPSSRSVAFRKSWWEAVGGYPEWLDYSEDLVFDLTLKTAGARFVFEPKAVARFRPRGSLRAFFQQYYRYARGDGKAGLWPRRHAVRYVTYLVAIPTLAFLTWMHHPVWLCALLSGAAAVFWTPYRRLGAQTHQWGIWERARCALWIPLIRVTGDVAKMIGYPAGLWWRYQHRRTIPDWRR